MTSTTRHAAPELWGSFATSSFSAQGACVEVAVSSLGNVKLRDSKLADSPILQFDSREWTAFLAGVRANEFELPD